MNRVFGTWSVLLAFVVFFSALGQLPGADGSDKRSGWPAVALFALSALILLGVWLCITWWTVIR